jgi:hypothetical protein
MKARLWCRITMMDAEGLNYENLVVCSTFLARAVKEQSKTIQAH